MAGFAGISTISHISSYRDDFAGQKAVKIESKTSNGYFVIIDESEEFTQDYSLGATGFFYKNNSKISIKFSTMKEGATTEWNHSVAFYNSYFNSILAKPIVVNRYELTCSITD